MPTISAWVFIINLCVVAAIVGLCCLGARDMDSFLTCFLWLGAPYVGHCGLALACRRDRRSSALVLGWTIFTVALLLLFCGAAVISARNDPVDHSQDDENGVGLVLLGITVLQWIAIAVLGIVLMVRALGGASGSPPKPSVRPLGELE